MNPKRSTSLRSVAVVENPKPETPPRTSYADIERGAIGPCAEYVTYRLREGTPADLLAHAISDGGDRLLAEGLATLADELHVFVSWASTEDARGEDEDFIRHTGDAIERRLRVLGELARRVANEVDTSTAIPKGTVQS